MKISIIGPPGSGKGTFAQYFSRKYCIPVLSTGDLLRSEIEKRTSIGVLFEKYVNSGQLVPDDMIIDYMIGKIKEVDTSRGLILDGYPRTLNQAYSLENVIKLDAVIYVYAPVDIVIERISNRYICPRCGYIYNLKFNPPRNDLVCDYDGTPLVRRRDDDPSIVKRRYELYVELTKPVVEYYRGRELLIEVDNSVSARLSIKILENLLLEKGILKLNPCREDVEL